MSPSSKESHTSPGRSRSRDEPSGSIAEMFESRVLPVTRSIGKRFDRLSFHRHALFSFWRPERVVEPTDRHRQPSVFCSIPAMAGEGADTELFGAGL
jgi:hypothetical protein